jgi:hypothetical protein
MTLTANFVLHAIDQNAPTTSKESIPGGPGVSKFTVEKKTSHKSGNPKIEGQYNENDILEKVVDSPRSKREMMNVNKQDGEISKLSIVSLVIV